MTELTNQPPTGQPASLTLTGTFHPPVELPVLGPGLVTWDGRTLQVTYAPGLTAEETRAGSSRVRAMHSTGTAVTDLAAWLLDRIAEDEKAARAAAPAPWSYGDIASVAGGSLYDPGVMIASIRWDNPDDRPEPIHRFRSGVQADATGEHIARWDPARVLADCEARRRIIAEHGTETEDVGWSGTETYCRRCRYDGGLDRDLFPCLTLRLLALPYANAPGYDEAWRP